MGNSCKLCDGVCDGVCDIGKVSVFISNTKWFTLLEKTKTTKQTNKTKQTKTLCIANYFCQKHVYLSVSFLDDGVLLAAFMAQGELSGNWIDVFMSLHNVKVYRKQ